MSRPVLGGLVGRSVERVKAVETGRLQAPRLPMLPAGGLLRRLPTGARAGVAGGRPGARRSAGSRRGRVGWRAPRSAPR
ncbi:MAG: hypothetical protein ACRDSP_07365 [Pseudonocardiaceae bacterium]